MGSDTRLIHTADETTLGATKQGLYSKYGSKTKERFTSLRISDSPAFAFSRISSVQPSQTTSYALLQSRIMRSSDAVLERTELDMYSRTGRSDSNDCTSSISLLSSTGGILRHAF